jgi:hypothetical protein
MTAEIHTLTACSVVDEAVSASCRFELLLRVSQFQKTRGCSIGCRRASADLSGTSFPAEQRLDPERNEDSPAENGQECDTDQVALRRQVSELGEVEPVLKLLDIDA